jgi:hypothetical protein
MRVCGHTIWSLAMHHGISVFHARTMGSLLVEKTFCL